jgi:hypothetical protein
LGKKKKVVLRAGGMTQVVEQVQMEALNSNPSTLKKKKSVQNMDKLLDIIL